MRKRLVFERTILGVAVALWLAGCSSSLKLVRSWADPGLSEGMVKKVFVIGVAQNDGVRRHYEDTFVELLQKAGCGAVQGYTLVPDPSEVDKQAIGALLKKDGVTHVLVTRLVARRDVESYHPPTYMSVGVGGYPGYYGGWGSYMSVGFSTVASPGYTTVSTVVSVESNLYDVSTEKLVWSGLSDGYLDDDPYSTIGPYIKSLIYAMRGQGVL
jgi:hypothetical protein